MSEGSMLILSVITVLEEAGKYSNDGKSYAILFFRISGIHLDKRTVSTVSTLQFGRMPILSINLENYCKYFIAQRHVSKWLTSLTICEEH